MNYAGMSSTLGLAFTKTGGLFPFFAPLIGWLGVFLTGSDTSSNALFSSMQRTTATAVGIPPELAVASNAVGGVTGKMISPQSISVATSATNMVVRKVICSALPSATPSLLRSYSACWCTARPFS